MGLTENLINAKLEGLRDTGADEEALEQAAKSLEVQTQLEVDAIVEFLTQCEFRITQLAANVILEDFKIPPQPADIEKDVKVASGIPTQGQAPGRTTSTGNLEGKRNGVRTKKIDISKSIDRKPPNVSTTGGLESTGYVYIGEDPEEQAQFDVTDEDGQKEFTTVKLLRDDIEEFL